MREITIAGSIRIFCEKTNELLGEVRSSMSGRKIEATRSAGANGDQSSACFLHINDAVTWVGENEAVPHLLPSSDDVVLIDGLCWKRIAQLPGGHSLNIPLSGERTIYLLSADGNVQSSLRKGPKRWIIHKFTRNNTQVNRHKGEGQYKSIERSLLAMMKAAHAHGSDTMSGHESLAWKELFLAADGKADSWSLAIGRIEARILDPETVEKARIERFDFLNAERMRNA